MVFLDQSSDTLHSTCIRRRPSRHYITLHYRTKSSSVQVRSCVLVRDTSSVLVANLFTFRADWRADLDYGKPKSRFTSVCLVLAQQGIARDPALRGSMQYPP